MALGLITRILLAGFSQRLGAAYSVRLANNDVIQFGLTNNEVVQYVGYADSGEEVVKLVKSLRPDIVLINAHIKGIGSLEAIKRIKKMSHKTHIIGFSNIDDGLYASLHFKAGAEGFIHPNHTLNDTLEAIKTVKDGQLYQCELTKSQIQSPPSTDLQPFVALTERELQVATMISQGYNNADIAKKLSISNKSILSYKARVFKKLSLSNDVELSHCALKHNMIIIEKSG